MTNIERIKKLLENNQDELMLVTDVAKMINQSRDRVIYLSNSGKLKPIKTNTGVRVFLKNDIINYMHINSITQKD